MQEVSIQCLTVVEEGSALKDVSKQQYHKACLEIENSLWRYTVKRKTFSQIRIKGTEASTQCFNAREEKLMSCTVSEGQRKWTDL